ncbi:MAG: ATP-dependent Clp protease proteolytic subunit [Actinomycetia bacterium]|nr:ATP-dependent Clp protease proteolytic subunit [Actinomycetes bacterium]MCP4227432.1 ATP-dependent Clp protease proteolytic subunit [Actinomycetes bacterium]MCP5033672.1 ATP-dependent Clp protease proteolytic subunit [Actinomycetes bacterium]
MTSPGLPQAEIAGSGFGFDIYQELLKSRIVFLGQTVDDKIANSLCAQMLYLASQDPDEDIWLYINSPGGSVTAGMALYDTMHFVKPEIATVCLGLGASMGQFLLTAGSAGKRYALPHSRVLMHQPSAGVQGQAADIAIQAENLVKIKKEMAELIAEHSGQPVEQIVADSDRDRWFSAEEAREYGLLDHVISRAGDLTDLADPADATDS